MARKPFVTLTTARAVNPNELPPDLAEFYVRNEGVGLESDCQDHPLRLCTLDEVTRVRWKDLDLFGDDIPEGWEGFLAFRIGMGAFGDEIVYVLDAPPCPHGSVLAIGRDLAGPGGAGPLALEPTLVLATSFADWLAHLEQLGWLEPAVTGTEDELSEQRKDELLRYYLALNPAARTS